MSIAIEPIVIFTLLNISLTLGLYISNLSGQLSLGTAAIAGIGGYLSAVLTTRFGISFPVAVLASMIVGAVVCAALAAMTCRMEMFVLKLVTLAFGEAVVVLAFNIDYLGGANSFTGITLHTGVWNTLVVAVVALAVAMAMDRSPIGYVARATRDDALAAAAMGVSIRGIRTLTFMVSGAIIGIAGALQAHYILVMNPHDLSFFISLSVVIFLLFGGIQSVWGAIVGAAILTVLPEALRFTNEFRHILFGALIVVIVMLRPNGLITRRPLDPNTLPDFADRPKIDPTGLSGKPHRQGAPP